MSENLYNRILESYETSQQIEELDEVVITYLVFRIGKNSYAIESAEVQEILRNNEVFPMPFVPPYIRGVLNSYGDPFAVLDLSVLFGGEAQDSGLFMILKNKNNISLQVSEIQEFHSSKDVKFQKISDFGEAQYFSGAITFAGRGVEEITVPILGLTEIIEKIRKDIENI